MSYNPPGEMSEPAVKLPYNSPAVHIYIHSQQPYLSTNIALHDLDALDNVSWKK